MASGRGGGGSGEKGLAVDAKGALDVAERTQGMWERGWQSGTAAILLVACALLLFLYLRSQHLRVEDKKEEVKRSDALLREMSAVVAENGKQLLVFQRALERALEESRPRRPKKPPEAPKETGT